MLYLSMIRDLYDNSIVAHKTGIEQAVRLVLETNIAAKSKEKVTTELQLHSDQGFQYTSHAYFNLTKDMALRPPCQDGGNCYDNAMAENFFSILKAECIYRAKPATIAQAGYLIEDYIWVYNNERIQLKTGEAPLARRLSA